MSSHFRIPPPQVSRRRKSAGSRLPSGLRARGALSNRGSRFLPTRVEREPDQSINPYRGCEHGCIYCYARPTHAWLDLSPGLDFETRLIYKDNAAAQLEAELRAPHYRCSPITLGANTVPYQPIEKRLLITRQILEVLLRFRHPVSLITKGSLITRDIDILSEMAADGLASVAVSVTTLDRDLKRAMEPRTPEGQVRLATIRALADAGVGPVHLVVGYAARWKTYLRRRRAPGPWAPLTSCCVCPWKSARCSRSG